MAEQRRGSPDSLLLPLAVVIPTHNRLALLERTIDSVLQCTQPPGRAVRVLVVENGGRFGTEQLLAKRQSWVRPEYHFCAQPNKSAALNACLDAIGDALIVFLDDDVRVDRDLLVRYADAAGHLRSGVFFGGGALVDYEEPPPQWLIDYLPPSARGWHPPDSSGISDTFAFLGFNWAAFSKDINKAGGFNPRFGPGGTSGGTGQERAMQIALRGVGCTARYVPEAVVWHYVPKNRCSAAWALKRAFRNSITAGFEQAGPHDQPSIAGVPKPVLRRAAKQAVAVCKHWFQSDARARFEVLHAFLTTCGRIRGVRARYVHDRQRG